jgi:C-terminal processing protease CtpA/Prc
MPFVRISSSAPYRLSLAALILAFSTATLPSLGLAKVEPKSTAVFDEAWRLVRDNFYDEKMKGLDWKKVGDRHRENYATAKTSEERSAAINNLLDELKSSHMIHLTPDKPAYFELVDIFRYGLRDEIRRHLSYGTISYPGIGIITRKINGKVFTLGVLTGLPADKAGLKTGDEILTVDGKPFAPIASFRGKLGQKVEISIRRKENGTPINITVIPETIKPGDAFETAMRDGARIIEANGKRIGYIHVWSYAGHRYQEILQTELAQGRLKDADALIWDLRDGWGGARGRFLDIFNPRAPDITMKVRGEPLDYASFRWRKPAAALINKGTRSGKEVLAYGFKKYGYGDLIGTRTAGALLAGRGYLLSDGTFLMIAVADVKIDGDRLEAKGLEPTIEVPFDFRYSAGRDPQLDKAVEILSSAPRG